MIINNLRKFFNIHPHDRDWETVKNAVETLEDIISNVKENYSEDKELLKSLEDLKSLIGEEA